MPGGRRCRRKYIQRTILIESTSVKCNRGSSGEKRECIMQRWTEWPGASIVFDGSAPSLDVLPINRKHIDERTACTFPCSLASRVSRRVSTKRCPGSRYYSWIPDTSCRPIWSSVLRLYVCAHMCSHVWRVLRHSARIPSKESDFLQQEGKEKNVTILLIRRIVHGDSRF